MKLCQIIYGKNVTIAFRYEYRRQTLTSRCDVIIDAMNIKNTFYASAFRRRRHYVFGLSVRPSVRPSVRSLKYPLLTCTWVRWSTRPTVTVLRHVRPSVRPERFPGICRRMHGWIGLKFYMLMYLDHLQN